MTPYVRAVPMVLTAILVAGSTAAGAASADQACPFQSRVFCAIRDGDADGLSAALDAGQSPNVVGRQAIIQGLTPLSYAIARTADPRIVAALLDKGADPNVVDPVARGGFTPLAHAASLGRARVVALLLQYGADPDLTGNDFPRSCGQLRDRMGLRSRVQEMAPRRKRSRSC